MRPLTRKIAILLTFILLLAFSIICAPTALAATWGDYEYTTTNGVATVTKYNGTETDITIPESVNGLPVTAIGSSAFSGKTALTGIVIPDGVTSIGSSAFYNCTGLTEIVFPDNVASIGSSALPGQAKLICYAGTKTAKTLTQYGGYPTSPTAQGFHYRQAEDANGVRTLTIVSYAGEDQDVSIPVSIDGVPVKTIGMGSSVLPVNVTRVEIPEGVETISKSAFYNRTNLTEIEIGSTVKTIG